MVLEVFASCFSSQGCRHVQENLKQSVELKRGKRKREKGLRDREATAALQVHMFIVM